MSRSHRTALAEDSLGSMTEHQEEVYELNKQGLTQKEIGEKLGITGQSVSKTLKYIEKKGYQVKKMYKDNLPVGKTLNTTQ